jgi:hypothetical protein
LEIPEDISGISGGYKSYAVGDGNTCATTLKSLLCWGKAKNSSIWPTISGNFTHVSIGVRDTCFTYTWTWGTEPKTGLECIDNSGNLEGTQENYSDVAGLGPTGALSCSLWYGYSTNEFAGASKWDCHGPSDLITNRLGNDGSLHMVVSGTSHACLLEDDLNVRCWGSDEHGQVDVPVGLSGVQSISAGGNHTCAVTVDSEAVCWGSNEFHESEVPNDLGPVAQIAAGGLHTCAVKTTSKIVCWGETAAQVVPNLNDIIPPKTRPVQLIQNDDSQIYVLVDPKVQKSDGELSWEVRDKNTKDVVCQFAYPATTCLIPGKIGQRYQFELVTKNQAGQSEPSVSSSLKFCPLEPANISASFVQQSVVTGGTARLTGQVSNLCQAMPKTIFTRSKAYGEKWSKWKALPLSSSGKFSSSLKVTVNTTAEMRLPLQTGNLTGPTIQIESHLKTGLPFSFAWSSNEVNGFNQGGLITVKFSGDKPYNGTCLISAVNSNAFNFALTYVGTERRFNTFSVKNGFGLGRVNMRWNGKVVVTASCTDPHYATVSDFRIPTLKASF